MRYSIRTLLVSATLVAALLGLFVFQLQRANSETEALKVIWKYRGEEELGMYHLGEPSDGRRRLPPPKHELARICREWFGEDIFVSVDEVHFMTAYDHESHLPKHENDLRFNDELIRALKALPDLKTIYIAYADSIPIENIQYARSMLPNVDFDLDDGEMLDSPPPPF